MYIHLYDPGMNYKKNVCKPLTRVLLIYIKKLNN